MCITVTQCNEGKELSGQPKMHKRWPHNMEHKLFKFQFDDNCKQRYHFFKLWCSSNQNYLYLNNRTAGCENNSSLLAQSSKFQNRIAKMFPFLLCTENVKILRLLEENNP